MKLSGNDKKILETLFNMRGGYVLDFSDRRMTEFFNEEFGINVYDEKYDFDFPSKSKANRLRGIWLKEDVMVVGQIILSLVDYFETSLLVEDKEIPQNTKDLEKEYEELHEQILNMQETRNKLEITEDEIHSFIRYAKALVEHPVEILANPINMREQLALYSVFFERFPTYEEIANGTPKLSLVFRLSEEDSRDKSQMVTLPGVEPGFKA